MVIKKMVLLSLLFLCTLFIFSCKKDEPVEQNNNEDKPNEDLPVKIEYHLIGDKEVLVGETTTLVIDNIKTGDVVTWSSSDESIAKVDDGVVSGVSSGSAIIKALINGEEVSAEVVVKEKEKTKPITLSGKQELVSGEITKLKVSFGEGEFDIEWSSSDNSIVYVENGTILALRPGKVTIKVNKVGDTRTRSTLEVTVSKYVADSYSDEEIAFAKNIMKNMSIDEMIGQMFIGSYAGTSLSDETINAVKNDKLGNFIFMGNNTPSGIEAAVLASSLQSLFMEELGIPAFISIDQETGRICRLTNGATRFLGNMASAATGDPFDRFLIGEAVGEELKTYGINFDLAPVLDVNNNPNNPVINNRSFSDNKMTVSLYGEQMMKGLMSQNVMACAKHFPGHGNTATDSHYGLPVINSSLNSLYQIELAPFIHAIYSGIDAIMTTHILFTDLDAEYPATLSKKILTGFLRNELGFNGLIVTDGMEMQGITSFYGDEEAAVLAVNAGADMLCYTTISGAVTGIRAVKAAYLNGVISKERIEEAVLRILIKKHKYDLFDNHNPKDNYASFSTASHEALNLEIAKKAVTVYKGNFSGLDKTKKTLIMSSKCSYQLKNYSGTDNSFGKYAKDYLISFGMKDIDFEYISSIKASDVSTLVNKAKGYEQIVIAISDANSAQISLVNELAKIRSDIIVVALNLPYDLNSYQDVNNYICIYENTPIMIDALTRLMNGEYVPTGTSPIKLNK